PGAGSAATGESGPGCGNYASESVRSTESNNCPAGRYSANSASTDSGPAGSGSAAFAQPGSGTIRAAAGDSHTQSSSQRRPTPSGEQHGGHEDANFRHERNGSSSDGGSPGGCCD